MTNVHDEKERCLRFHEAGHLMVCEYSCPELEADVRIGSVLLAAYEASESVQEGFRKLMLETFSAYAMKMTGKLIDWNKTLS